MWHRGTEGKRLHRECEKDEAMEDEGKKAKGNTKRRKLNSSNKETPGTSATFEAAADVSSGDEDLIVFPGCNLLTEIQEIEALKYIIENDLMRDMTQSDYKNLKKKREHWTALGLKYGCNQEQIKLWFNNVRCAYEGIIHQVHLGCEYGLLTQRSKFIWTHATFLFCSLWKKMGADEN